MNFKFSSKSLLAVVILIAFTFFAACSSKKKTPVSTTTDTIEWLDWDSGLAKAKKENKIILIDAYTDWCRWCKVMDKKTYSNASVINKINESFIAVKLNPEKTGTYVVNRKTMSGPQLHSWLGNGRTFGYPTTYFLTNPNDAIKKIYPIIGYYEANKFEVELNKALELKNKN